MRRTIHAALFKGDCYFVADCLEIPVVTQGLTVDETLSNLREAVALHMEDEDLEEVGLIRNPTISVTEDIAMMDGAHKVKLVKVGDSKGICIPEALLKEYGWSDSLVMQETESGILLMSAEYLAWRKKRDAEKLGWEETARQMEAAGNYWEDDDWSYVEEYLANNPN